MLSGGPPCNSPSGNFFPSAEARLVQLAGRLKRTVASSVGSIAWNVMEPTEASKALALQSLNDVRDVLIESDGLLAEPSDRLVPTRPAHQPCVYFIQACEGGAIKIGFTTSLSSRLDAFRTSLPGLRLLAVVAGNRQGERATHRLFGSLRLSRRREWFCPGKPLLAFIDRLEQVDALIAGLP